MALQKYCTPILNICYPTSFTVETHSTLVIFAATTTQASQHSQRYYCCQTKKGKLFTNMIYKETIFGYSDLLIIKLRKGRSSVMHMQIRNHSSEISYEMQNLLYLLLPNVDLKASTAHSIEITARPANLQSKPEIITT